MPAWPEQDAEVDINEATAALEWDPNDLTGRELRDLIDGFLMNSLRNSCAGCERHRRGSLQDWTPILHQLCRSSCRKQR